MNGWSGVPAVDRADLGFSSDSGHVTILSQVMVGSCALGTTFNHSSVMYNLALVSEILCVTCNLIANNEAAYFLNMFTRQDLPGERTKIKLIHNDNSLNYHRFFSFFLFFFHLKRCGQLIMQ